MALSCSRMAAPVSSHVAPHPLDERLAADVEPGEPLLREQALDHVLRRDAGVVGARKPEHPPSPHPLEPDQHVLHGVVETVTHVERGRDVGRRHHHHVGLGRLPAGENKPRSCHQA